MKIDVFTTCSIHEKNDPVFRYSPLRNLYDGLKSKGHDVIQDTFRDGTQKVWCGLGFGHDVQMFSGGFLKRSMLGQLFTFIVWDLKWLPGSISSVYIQQLKKHKFISLSQQTQKELYGFLGVQSALMHWGVQQTFNEPLSWDERQHDFVFIGANPHRRPNLARQLKDMGLDVVIIDGSYGQLEKASAIKRSRFNLNLSTWDGWCLVPAECASYGTPVFGTEIQHHKMLQCSDLFCLFPKQYGLDQIFQEAQALVQNIDKHKYIDDCCKISQYMNENLSIECLANNFINIIKEEHG